MGSPQDKQAFLGAGVWIPVEVADQLSHCLQSLRRWTRAHEPLNPEITLLIKVELSEIDHLVELSRDYNILVSAERWRYVVRKICLFTEQLIRSNK